jgi:hypothetical protein
LLILPARTPGNKVAQRLDHYDGLTSAEQQTLADELDDQDGHDDPV